MDLQDTSIGQHFLINPRILNLIASLVPPSSNIIELGAGLGQLTEKLVRVSKNIVAVEIDNRFLDSLEGLARTFPHLKVHIGDILRFDFNYFPNPLLVGNIPYHLTEPLLHKLIKQPISGAILLVGDKFAYEATTVDPDSQYFGKLSFLVNTFFEPKIITMVEKGDFDPPPRTRSALIELTSKQNDGQIGLSDFISRQLFMTAPYNSLIKNVITKAIEIYNHNTLTKNQARDVEKSLKIEEKIRNTPFEQLSNAQYRSLYKSVRNHTQVVLEK